MIRKKVWEIDVNPSVKKDIPRFNMKQGELNSNAISLLVFEDGKPFNLEGKTVSFVFETVLPSRLKGKTVSFVFEKVNKELVMQTNLDELTPVIIEGNEALCHVKNSVLLDTGRINVEVTIAENNATIISRIMDFGVASSLMFSEVDETDIPILQSLITQVQNAINDLADISENEVKREGLYDEMVILQTSLESLKLKLETLQSNLTSLELEVTTNEGERVSNELLREALKVELETLQDIVSVFFVQFKIDSVSVINQFDEDTTLALSEFDTNSKKSITDYELDSQTKLNSFVTTGGQAITDFETNSQGSIDTFLLNSSQAITDLELEITRVQGLYEQELLFIKSAINDLETTKINNKNYSLKFEVVDNQPRIKLEELI